MSRRHLPRRRWRWSARLLWRRPGSQEAARPGKRLYFVAIGLVFLFAALDEYRVLHEYVSRWRQYYAVLGLAVVTATLAIAGALAAP